LFCPAGDGVEVYFNRTWIHSIQRKKTAHFISCPLLLLVCFTTIVIDFFVFIFSVTDVVFVF